MTSELEFPGKDMWKFWGYVVLQTTVMNISVAMRAEKQNFLWESMFTCCGTAECVNLT